MKFHKHTFVFIAHLSSQLFNEFSANLSNFFSEQSNLLSFTAQHEQVTGFSSFTVTADVEIDRDIMAKVVDFADACHLSGYYLISNNDAGNSVQPAYLLLRVIKLSSFQESIVMATKELLSGWQIGGRHFGFEVAIFKKDYIRLACYSSRQLPEEMITDIDKIFGQYQTLLSHNI
jgi:hypothetical protein